MPPRLLAGSAIVWFVQKHGAGGTGIAHPKEQGHNLIVSSSFTRRKWLRRGSKGVQFLRSARFVRPREDVSACSVPPVVIAYLRERIGRQ